MAHKLFAVQSHQADTFHSGIGKTEKEDPADRSAGCEKNEN